ncbi:metal-dependent hydrolase [Ornithinimicrobium murale]|uniref:metal-dependent hydrolase n=1 Tax=Ornithinimicrobium murale TaxID=1050153 RepID=UPI0013B40E9F|nr:metal-dependent hydrolase [Ornithinimicrobium murale]
MGYNHAASGMLVGVATVGLVPVQHWSEQVAWVLALGGAAMSPDLDTGGSHAARMWGAPTRLLGTGLGAVVGGHRQGTHDAVLVSLTVAVGAWLAGLHPISLTVALALCIGLALRGLMVVGAGRIGAPLNLIASGLGAWWLVNNGAGGLELLPLVLAGGVLVHILGDLITTEGVPIPIVWLFGVKQRISLQLFSVNSRMERAVVAPALSLGTVFLLAGHLGIHDLASLLEAGDLIVRTVLPGLASTGSVSPHI